MPPRAGQGSGAPRLRTACAISSHKIVRGAVRPQARAIRRPRGSAGYRAEEPWSFDALKMSDGTLAGARPLARGPPTAAAERPRDRRAGGDDPPRGGRAGHPDPPRCLARGSGSDHHPQPGHPRLKHLRRMGRSDRVTGKRRNRDRPGVAGRTSSDPRAPLHSGLPALADQLQPDLDAAERAADS